MAWASSSAPARIRASWIQMRSAPDFFRHLPAAPHPETLALSTRKGPGRRASPTLSIQRGRCASP
eukprot:7107977-Lingulodinium_polyedra.AAC.1